MAQSLVPHVDNPFREQILREKELMRIVQRTLEQDDTVAERTVTVTIQEKYRRGPFAQVYTHKYNDALAMLSPNACYLFLWIVRNLTYNQEKIKLHYHDINMDRRVYKAAMLDLVEARIISPDKNKWWYWVNVTLVIVGKL